MFLGFLGKMFSDSQAADNYSQVLFDELINTQNARAALKKANEYGTVNKLSDDEIQSGQAKAAQKITAYLQSGNNIPERELSAFKFLVNCIPLKDSTREQIIKLCSAKAPVPIVNKGNILPRVGPNVVSLPIALKNGESLQYRAKATYLKKTRKTVGVDFAGPVASFRICKGVRYRIGSVNIQRRTVENYDYSDQGVFYITNMRIGYFGKKQFSFDIKKLVSIQSGDACLLFYKAGRENPFMIALDNYDAPCEIISNLLNQ